MFDIELDADSEYALDGKPFSVIAGKMYIVSADIVGFAGNPYCSFFGISLLDKSNQSLGQRIRWLHDFSGNRRTYSILFRAPEDCVAIRLMYRINSKHAPDNAACKYRVPPLEQIAVHETSSFLQESYDISHQFLPSSQTLSSEEEDALERNLVWIFALPRSGTTWLGTQLLSYNSHNMEEPLIGKHLGRAHSDPKQFIRTIALWSPTKPNYFFNPKYAKTLVLHIRKLILNRIHAQFRDLSRKIIIYESDGSIAADIISQCLPNSKVIFLLRDGRDVIDNIDQVSWFLSEARQSKDQSKEGHLHNYLRKQSILLAATTELLLETHERRPKEQSMIIKYEDLRSNTFEVLKQIYKFIGTEIADNKLNEIMETFKGNVLPRLTAIDRWKNRFTKEEIAVMENVMRDILNKLGYDLEASLNKREETRPNIHQQFFNLSNNDIESYNIDDDRADALERNLVWIFALPRSGTTWLGTQLLSYNSHNMEEPLIGSHLGNWLLFEDNLRAIDTFANKENYFFNTKYRLVWQFYLRRLILNRVYAQFQDVSKKTIIKEPNGSIAADIISQCLPNSKVIFLLRDGRDVVDSKVDSIREGGWQSNVSITVSSSNLEQQRLMTMANAKDWAATTELLLETHERRPKEQSMIIKYEDLRSNTFEVLKQIYKFIGTEIADNKLNEIVKGWAFENLPESIKGPGKFFRAASPGKWREHFSDGEKEEMWKIMGNTLSKLGYSP